MTREEAIETLVKLQYIIDGEDSHWNIPMNVVFDAILTVIEELRKDDIIIKELYEQGLKDAWECARKLSSYVEDGGFTDIQIREIFEEEPTLTKQEIYKFYSAAEAVKKIKEYEKRQEERIKVGDEVQDIYFGEKMIVIETYSDGTIDGFSLSRGLLSNRNATNFKKTGKFYPEAEAIAITVHQMKGIGHD